MVAGRLGVVTEDGEGHEAIICHISPGETVGEMALLSGAPRSATVVALRDSELVRLKRESFEKLADQHPGLMRFVTRLLVNASSGRRITTLPRPTAYRSRPYRSTERSILPLSPDRLGEH